MKNILKFVAISTILSTAAFAQTAMPTPVNPLRPTAPPAVVANPPAAMPAKPAVKAPAAVETKEAKPKRARSEKQKANDDIMRKCGAEWRADKAAGKTGSTTWRQYLPQCRAKMKAA